MISSLLLTMARVPMSLRGLQVCVACDECFSGDVQVCPACGGLEHVTLSNVLRGGIFNITGLN
jgi:hypothetical protein